MKNRFLAYLVWIIAFTGLLSDAAYAGKMECTLLVRNLKNYDYVQVASDGRHLVNDPRLGDENSFEMNLKGGGYEARFKLFGNHFSTYMKLDYEEKYEFTGEGFWDIGKMFDTFTYRKRYGVPEEVRLRCEVITIDGEIDPIEHQIRYNLWKAAYEPISKLQTASLFYASKSELSDAAVCSYITENQARVEEYFLQLKPYSFYYGPRSQFGADFEKPFKKFETERKKYKSFCGRPDDAWGQGVKPGDRAGLKASLYAQIDLMKQLQDELKTRCPACSES